MKLLNEVIRALRCTDPKVDPETKCEDCPYKESRRNELWYVGQSCLDEMFADALHYLKEYRDTDEYYKKAIAHVTEVIDHYEKMVADYLAVNNPPLTWDELRGMQGKPVWVENIETQVGRWIIIANFTGRNEELACMISSDRWIDYWKKDQGKTWNAFRKERK